MDVVKSTDVFSAALEKPTKETCHVVKAMAEGMSFDDKQKAAFDHALAGLPGDLFAVRSSSPEEDLEGASFAGMYETLLGVKPDGVEEAVAKAFASCFDVRVMAYKKQKGMDLAASSIAVVVQRQLASEVSGVGFSLNPLNNCFDEVVINASFGLGEAIVSGLVSPDHYVYDAAAKELIEKKVTEKAIGLFLKEDGGIEEKELKDKDIQALSDGQIVELADLIKDCEAYYGKPVDTEWAYEGGKLYLLQARPITTYLPFFEELLTEPGAPKRFYIDLMMMTQGFTEPMSVLGLELWGEMLNRLKQGTMGPDVNGTSPAIHGRQYLSPTAIQKVLGKKNGARILTGYDGNIRKIFEGIDLNAHPFAGIPVGSEHFKSRILKVALKMLPNMVKAIVADHESVVAAYNQTAQEVMSGARDLKKETDFEENVDFILTLLEEISNTIGIMYAGMMAQRSIKKRFKGQDIEKEFAAMAMDLDGNPTSEMGRLLFSMASADAFKQVESREAFKAQAETRSFDEAFLKVYDEFMEKYAVRGFKEIDVASMRIYEDLGLLYDKLIEINTEDNQILHVKEKRQEAYDRLRQAARENGFEKKFIRAADKLKATFGYREHPKYVVVYIYAMLHNICLEMAEDWVEAGRLDKAYEIFDLTIKEIARAQRDSDFDLRAARDKNLEGYAKVAHIKTWPLVIDSRGKIYRADLEIRDGDIIGDAIAPGKVVGKAKVLKSPYEKPLNPGEILVTRATEPSWTPIFTNASGVIMEVGGPLQHGGIIAREYGIPCVSGLIGIMDMVKDGDLLEVDGTNGLVKIMDNQPLRQT
jgi:pyruvate,water dikinase